MKADAYGHGAGRWREAALAGGATWLAVATAGEAAELRGRRRRADARDGRAHARGARGVAIDAEAGRGGVVARRSPRPAPRVHVKLDTGMGRLGTRDRRAGAVGWPRGRTTGWRLMTHFATADELGDDLFPAQLERFRGFVDERRRATTWSCTPPTAPPTLREPAAHFDMVRCGVAIYGLDPFQADPAAHGLEPALSLHSWVAACGASSRARAPATAAAGRPRSPPGSPRCRSATATAGGARSRTTPTC